MQELIGRVEAAVRKGLEGEGTGHDFYHIDRVRNMALRIAQTEGGDKELIELAALVHDVGDHKFHESEEAGRAATFALLEACKVPKELALQVADIAHRVSFKGVSVPDNMPTLEGKIVQDADRLDAIGAIAIARVFTYGGAKSRPMYDPTMPLNEVQSSEDYLDKNRKASSFHHFFEKLLHLKGRMHTNTARLIAENRHAFMQEYIDHFLAEWEGKD